MLQNVLLHSSLGDLTFIFDYHKYVRKSNDDR